MTTNPYSPPTPTETHNCQPEAQTQSCGLEIGWLVLSPIVFTVAGAAWYLFAASFAENFVMPYVEPYKYTYGAPAIFLCLPLSTFYGLLTGFAVSILGTSQRKYCGVALLVVAAITSLCTIYWWNQFENAAECNSKYVLFYPLFALSILVGFAGIILSRVSNTKRIGG